MSSPPHPSESGAAARTFAAVLALNALWAPVNFMIHTASGGLSPNAIALSRWLGLSAVVTILLAIPAFRRFTRWRSCNLVDAIICVLIGMFLIGLAHGWRYIALQHTTTTEGTIVHTSLPLWTALFSIAVLKEHPNALRWGSIILGSLGAYLVAVGFGAPPTSVSHLAGNLNYLAAVIVESLGIVLSVRLIFRSSGIAVMVWSSWGAVLGIAVFGMLRSDATIQVLGWTPAVVSSVAYMILFSGVIAFVGWFLLAEVAPVSFLIVGTLIQAPIAGILGYFALGESITLAMILGTSIIVVALVLNGMSSKGAKKSPAQGTTIEPDGAAKSQV